VDLETIQAVIDQYAKHGWQLRRALVSAEGADRLSAEPGFAEVRIVAVDSGNEALWFSRRSLPDREAWELRRLSGSPFALVAILEDSFDDGEREGVLEATERRMFDGSHPEPTSH
jgi:hypothetical protein